LAAVEHVRADHFLAVGRAEHQAFYKWTFRHRRVCPLRPYALLKSPICQMSVGYDEAVDHVRERYPFFRSNVFERRRLFEANVAGFQVAGEQRKAA
jgi:hypothetical protein